MRRHLDYVAIDLLVADVGELLYGDPCKGFDVFCGFCHEWGLFSQIWKAIASPRGTVFNVNRRLTSMLREQLREITFDHAIDRHRERIEALRLDTAHSIEVLSAENDRRDYNCVMFALGIEFDPDYRAMITHCPREVHASTDFLNFLIAEGDLIEQLAPADGLLISYADGERIRHVGKLAGTDRVISKWGIGHLYDHAPLEVPSDYGENFRYFSPISREAALDAFYNYARQRDVEFPFEEG